MTPEVPAVLSAVPRGVPPPARRCCRLTGLTTHPRVASATSAFVVWWVTLRASADSGFQLAAVVRLRSNISMRYASLVPFVIALCLGSPLARAQADNPQEPRKPELPEIQPLWAPYQAGLKAVAADRDKKLANLDNIYMLNLDRMKKERAEAVDLDGALAVKAEMDRLGAHQATSEEQRNAMPPALRALRASYDAALKGYGEEAAKGEEALRQRYLADLADLEKRITTTGDLDKALKVKAERDRIAAQGTAQPALPPVPPAKNEGPLLADSAADFSDTQGKNNWSYGYFIAPKPGGPYVTGEFKPFPQYRVTNRGAEWVRVGGPQWLAIRATHQHPGAHDGRAFWAVRRWTSQSEGSARITGEARRVANGDGSTLRIFVDGREVFTRLLGGHQPLTAKFDLALPLHAGSTVDLAVDTGPGTDTGSDAVTLTATIRR